MAKLTMLKCKAALKPGLHPDGGTLYLRVAPGGSRSWIQRLVIQGKRSDIGLGAFPLVSLAEAREAAFDNRRLARRGGDPVAGRREAKVPTFREAVEKTIEAMRARWRKGGPTESIWRRTLEKHAFPAFGDKPVNLISREDVLRVVTPIWTSKPEVAKRTRQFTRSVLSWAQAHGYVEHNVAGEAIAGALPAATATRQHHRALPFQDVPEALRIVDASKAGPAVKLCFNLVVLTAVRNGEARFSRWAEFDLEARMWTIPAERTKVGTEHRVPLSDAAVAVLEAARVLGDGSGLVFPSPMKRGRPLSDMALTKLLRDAGLSDRCVVHGFRSSFRDWCAETGKPREIAEAALAHTVAGVEGAYFRSDLFDRRRRLMDHWASFVTASPAGKVVPIHG